MNRNVLVCGGAGYIGSHLCEWLAAEDIGVVVFDNLDGGMAAQARWGTLVTGDLRDPRALEALFAAHRFDAVMQLAGRIVVSESVRDPAGYHEHNVVGTRNLLRAGAAHGAPPVVFSSSAAVYGDPQYTPIDEAHPCVPVNPYGATKMIAERMLADFEVAHGMRSVSLRYFNAAGASASGLIGESHRPETHLIPNVLRGHAMAVRLTSSAMTIRRPTVPVCAISSTSQTSAGRISRRSRTCGMAVRRSR